MTTANTLMEEKHKCAELCFSSINYSLKQNIKTTIMQNKLYKKLYLYDFHLKI